MKVRFAFSCLMAATTVSCGEPAEKSSAPSVVSPPAVYLPPEPPKPPHRYGLKDGNSYAYIAGLSEEERKKGKASGDVLMFRYLGKKNGIHTVANLNNAGQTTIKSSCAEPCVIIKYTDGSRSAFTPESIIGAVFQDAIAGYLEDSSGSKGKLSEASEIAAASALIPKAFQGVWNVDLASCGERTNDTGLRVGPSKLEFYESEGEVKSVRVRDPRSIVVTAASVGEGEKWDSQMKLELSAGGDILVVKSEGSDFARLRCPKS